MKMFKSDFSMRTGRVVPTCSRIPVVCQSRSTGGSRDGARPRRQAQGAPNSSQGPQGPKKTVNLPEYGMFSEADVNAPIYPPLAGVDSADLTKRGGRYTSDFIWNTEWAKQLDYQQELEKSRELQNKEAAAQSGGLSLSRRAELDSIDVDLSDELKASKPLSVPVINVRPKKVMKEVYAPPSQGEARRWARSGRFSKRVMKVASSEEDERAAEENRLAEAERYESLKRELQQLNLALTALLFAATYAFYPTNVAYSYLFGAVGGAQYLRMLNRSVESYGGGGGVGGVLGQQRILIPIILALGFNRFNELASESTGVTLQLLPILVGFFTYKLAVVSRSSYDLLRDLTTDYGGSSGEEPGPEAGEDARREYSGRVLRG
uniref:ATP synthase protein I n=1 Tax=Tetraselmis sp. GSL018 TaxID=582737 RepID=A0A061RV55_9CHLO|mmetsp:Transcript_31467/g.74775  ORF Transcript_31467/g.74775 Transcript_31467/m.74775 type:complete len:377 (+) Transcript_31467:103-1233(+)